MEFKKYIKAPKDTKNIKVVKCSLITHSNNKLGQTSLSFKLELILNFITIFFILTFFFLFSTEPKIIVRPEEALIVIFVLILWVGAIALFFNRWGKIRMLEPYQPKFEAKHRSSCPLVDIDQLPSIGQVSSSFCVDFCVSFN